MNSGAPRELTMLAKELDCVYRMDEILQDKSTSIPDGIQDLVDALPGGFSVPPACRVRIRLWGFAKQNAADFPEGNILYSAPLNVGEERAGILEMAYVPHFEGRDLALLDSERKMLDTIVKRIELITLNILREVTLMIDTLQRVDPAMLIRIAEKLRVHIRNTVEGNVDIFHEAAQEEHLTNYGEVNAPSSKPPAINTATLSKKMIAGATAFLREEEIFSLINGWIQEQRILALVKTVDSKYAGIDELLDAVRRYNAAMVENAPRPVQTETWLVAELAHRLLTNDNRIVDLILGNIHISDFESMLERIIASGKSSGNVGGKGAGLFIAKQILRDAAVDEPLLKDIKTPKSWYMAADTIVDFLHYNNLEELSSYKYNGNQHLRMTYDNVVTKVKNAKLPPHVVQMLSVALDDMGDKALIVRSSSLLEDRHDGAFSGKYKSLFLANQGSKKDRLAALQNAILEVYSSMYNPDSIQYRKERGLLNFNEQMGVLIQEVVGRKIGCYFLPAFAGVAFSHNLLRWSPRIKRESGLVRMVMGLGTRAVDRVSDDYPVLFSPGQPELRVNQTPSDIRHYSPRHIDLINLETGRFETVDAAEFFRGAGDLMPDLYKYISVFNDDFIESRNMFTLDTRHDEIVVTFDHILTKTDIPKRLKLMLETLSRKIDNPVDIEFAYDGYDMYILQCRPQMSGMLGGPAPIPKHLDPMDILFTANRHIADGKLADITHIVYVDGEAYSNLSTREDLLEVGKVVGMLNDYLPKRKFILMGPGRWGSRGDIKLGVRVTYSDISGTAALIEIAKAKHSYVPELSFGTHFFQDLVESGIVYVPLYPDQKGIVFKESFFLGGPNILEEILPDHAWLADVVKVIDVPRVSGGRTLSLHMNSDLEQAVAFLRKPKGQGKAGSDTVPVPEQTQYDPETGRVRHDRRSAAAVADDAREHWQWRDYMARQIADNMDMEAFGLKAIYLLGGSGGGSLGLEADIDLLLHVRDGFEESRKLLDKWLDGWSRALAKAYYLQTGYNVDQLLDVHYITDADIEEGTSYALKIDATIDPAVPLRQVKPTGYGFDPGALRTSE